MKLFSFNAGSFALEPAVEEYLKSRRAIALDLGQSAYINSDVMPSILAELAARPAQQDSSEALVAQLKAELAKSGAERQKLLEEGMRLASQQQSAANEAGSLGAQVLAGAKALEAARAENARLQAAQKSAPVADAGQNEKLAKEFQALKAQSIEAITSLKVLEDENEELRDEIDMLRNQLKNVPAQKAA